MKYGLSDGQLEEIKTILKKYSNIKEAIIFGSRAIDTFKEASDIDIAIKGEGVDFSTVAKLKYELEEETYIPFFFDIVSYNTIQSDELLEHTNKKGKVFYRRETKEWREVRLEDIVSKLGDGLHGTPKYDENGEYFFINGNNLNNGKITIKDSTKKLT